MAFKVGATWSSGLENPLRPDGRPVFGLEQGVADVYRESAAFLKVAARQSAAAQLRLLASGADFQNGWEFFHRGFRLQAAFHPAYPPPSIKAYFHFTAVRRAESGLVFRELLNLNRRDRHEQDS